MPLLDVPWRVQQAEGPHLARTVFLQRLFLTQVLSLASRAPVALPLQFRAREPYAPGDALRHGGDRHQLQADEALRVVVRAPYSNIMINIHSE
jgi:hypothetical protein